MTIATQSLARLGTPFHAFSFILPTAPRKETTRGERTHRGARHIRVNPDPIVKGLLRSHEVVGRIGGNDDPGGCPLSGGNWFRQERGLGVARTVSSEIRTNHPKYERIIPPPPLLRQAG